MKFIDVASVRQRPDTLFVFGDNMQGWGKKGQAIIRDEPNAVGIPTKWKPATTADAYFTDRDFEAVKGRIDASLSALMNHKEKGGSIVLPSDGVGTGLAQLPTRAPRIHAYISARLRELSSN
jgi:hypothetical protein